MSQQAAAGQGAGRGGGRKPRFIPRGGGDNIDKPFRLTTVGIEKWKFNTGQNKYPAQFTLHRKEVANYIQRTLADEGYLVAQTIRSRTKQSIPLPSLVDPNNPDKADLEAIQNRGCEDRRKEATKAERVAAKRVCYGVHSQRVQDKLKALKDWETVQQEQLLHNLIFQVERI